MYSLVTGKWYKCAVNEQTKAGFDCKQWTCHDCFRQLVQTCPSVMLRHKGLWLFKPDRDDTHCYHCPFCKKVYTPQMKMQLHVCGMVDTASKMEVCKIVDIPYAYQSFDNDILVHIATEAEFVTVNERYIAYLDRMEMEALEESATLQEERVWSMLDATTNANFEQLRELARMDL